MPRTQLPTPDELAWASQLLRNPTTVDDYGSILREVFDYFFNPLQFWYFHFFGGEFHLLSQNVSGSMFSEEDIPAMVEKATELYQSTRPWEPADIVRHGKYVLHVAELYQWYHGKDISLERFREELWEEIGLDWQIGGHIFDGDVQQAGVGIARPFAEGDFSAHDMATFEAIFPHIQDGYNQAAAFTRAQLFGGSVATAVEYHPSAMFIFDASGKVRYANHAACTLIQKGTEGHSELPMASKSPLVKQILQTAMGTAIEIPGVHSVSSHTLPDWPNLNLKQPRLVVVNTVREDVPAVSPREREMILLAARDGIDEAAAALGITVSTAYTHLRNAYKALGVSGLADAAAFLYLSNDSASLRDDTD